MCSSFPSSTAFSAYYFSWEWVSAQVLLIIRHNILFFSTLDNNRLCRFKVLGANYCVMMTFDIVLRLFTPIAMPVKLRISECFLKEHITRIFLIFQDFFNYRWAPFAASLCQCLFLSKCFCYFIAAFSRKAFTAFFGQKKFNERLRSMLLVQTFFTPLALLSIWPSHGVKKKLKSSISLSNPCIDWWLIILNKILL